MCFTVWPVRVRFKQWLGNKWGLGAGKLVRVKETRFKEGGHGYEL